MVLLKVSEKFVFFSSVLYPQLMSMFLTLSLLDFCLTVKKYCIFAIGSKNVNCSVGNECGKGTDNDCEGRGACLAVLPEECSVETRTVGGTCEESFSARDETTTTTEATTSSSNCPASIPACSVSLGNDCCKLEDCASGSACKWTTSSSVLLIFLF